MGMQNGEHEARRTVALAGATGDLGRRIARALVAAGARVVALVRPEGDAAKRRALELAGARVRVVDFGDVRALRGACRGAESVVSALNGLEDVILGAQGRLLEAAISAGVPRFIPSDFSLDFTHTRAGRNRNLDLRRTFFDRVDAADIAATSIMTGAYADLLLGQAHIVMPRIHRVVYWGDETQRYDFTARDDVAWYTAQAALDDQAPRVLRIASFHASPRDLAAVMTELGGERFRTLHAGSIRSLSGLIALTKRLSPGTNEVFPAWQGMQYLRDMAEGDGVLVNLDRDRYGARRWVTARTLLAPLLGAHPLGVPAMT